MPAGSTKIFETAKFIFLSISAFGVLFSVLLSSFNSLEASIYNRDKVIFDRTENAFRYMERWEAPTLKEARDLLREIVEIQSTIAPDELVDKIEGTGSDDAQKKVEQKNLKRSVITMFNFFEEIELSLQASRCNEDFVKRYFKDIYKNIFEAFKVWLNSPRNKHIGTDMKNNLESLNKKW